MEFQTERKRQDKILDDLGTSVSALKGISIDTRNELEVHIELIEEVDTDVELVQENLSRASSRLGRVSALVKKNGSCLLIGLLCALIVIFIVLLFTI